MNHSQTAASDFFKAAVIFFLLAHLVPAFSLGGYSLYGWMAFCFGFFALLKPHDEIALQVASFLGIMANLGYVATFIARLNHACGIARTSARFATVAAFASVIILAVGGDRFLPLPGCILWLLTGLSLLRATR